MNVSLTVKLDRFVAEKVSEGMYASSSEVVRAGLRLLIERERMIEARIEAGRRPSTAALDAEVAASLAGEEAPVSDGQTQLPASLWLHFPEYDARVLSLEAHLETIIDRLLGVAQLEAVRWLLANVPKSELASFLIRREGRGLDPKSLRFWGLLLDLPTEDVSRWVEAARSGPWGDRVAR